MSIYKIKGKKRAHLLFDEHPKLNTIVKLNGVIKCNTNYSHIMGDNKYFYVLAYSGSTDYYKGTNHFELRGTTDDIKYWIIG